MEARFVSHHVFLLCRSFLTALLYTLLRRTEESFAKSQFQSIARRAFTDCSNIVKRKRLSMESMAAVMSQTFHNASEWPFVTMKGYETIVDVLSRSGGHDNMGFAPIVQAGEEQSNWEDFAYDYFDTRISNDGWPNTTGINKFGRGIWRMKKTENGTVRIHDNDEVTLDRELLTPIIQCCVDNPGDKILLFNLYSERARRETMNGIIECSKTMRQSFGQAQDHLHESCWAMTEFVRIVRFNQVQASSSIMFAPIYPADAPWEVSGFILSPLVWYEIFENVFSDVTQGVHCVLTHHRHHIDGDNQESFTFTIRNGHVESITKNEKDTVHDHDNDKYGILRVISGNLTSYQEANGWYSLTIVPTDEFIDSYATNNPRNATIAALSVILLITVLFFFYDFFVRREFYERAQVLKAKRTFIRYVSHEVRTPLNAVIMGLNIIQDEEKDTERSQLIQEIQNSANSAVNVLNEVLQYDKIESDSLDLEINMVDIWELSTKLLDEFKASATNKKVQLKMEYDIDLPGDVEAGKVSRLDEVPARIRDLRVLGDTPKIQQVLRNLLSNAIKFSEDLVVLTISYSAKSMTGKKSGKSRRSSVFMEKIKLKNGEEIQATPGGYFQLNVRDNGVGMNEDQLLRLFGEGVQFNANDLQAGKGSGLGLFIARNLVLKHKGNLSASSEGIGKGSDFKLQLPLYQHNVISTIEENINGEEECVSESSSNCERHLRILVVDDVATNRKLLCRLLERSGHQCSMAENGEVAVKMVQENMTTSGGNEGLYDCILMDYEMPVLNGPNACKQIRDLGFDVFIVGVTGNTLNDDVQYFKAKGANAVLPKPVNLKVLENLFVEYGL